MRKKYESTLNDAKPWPLMSRVRELNVSKRGAKNIFYPDIAAADYHLAGCQLFSCSGRYNTSGQEESAHDHGR